MCISSFVTIPLGKTRACCLAFCLLDVMLLLVFFASSHGAMKCSVVCECGISWSYSLAFLNYKCVIYRRCMCTIHSTTICFICQTYTQREKRYFWEARKKRLARLPRCAQTFSSRHITFFTIPIKSKQSISKHSNMPKKCINYWSHSV